MRDDDCDHAGAARLAAAAPAMQRNALRRVLEGGQWWLIAALSGLEPKVSLRRSRQGAAGHHTARRDVQ
jgi:hypothetical protein